MISLYGGRLKLEMHSDAHQWVAHVIVGPKQEHKTSKLLETKHLYTAQQRAIGFYRQFKAEHLPDRLTCWTCKQWSPKTNRCQVGVPECRQTGGRFAPNCALYQGLSD
jgi:hypothetical protein